MKIRTLSITIVLFLMTILFFSSPHTVQAAICTWTGGSGNWNEAANWSCGLVPGSGDDAIINNGGTVTLTANASVSSLTLSNGTLTGSYNLTADTIDWSNGQMSGSGSTNVTSEVNFTGAMRSTCMIEPSTMLAQPPGTGVGTCISTLPPVLLTTRRVLLSPW